MKKWILLLMPVLAMGQNGPAYWQQEVNYKMQIDFDVEKHQFAGDQYVTYFNNSPDTISELFYHLYFNAFQPGSMMDARSRDLPDPDKRVGDRISKLKKDEMGYHRIEFIVQGDKVAEFKISETVMHVNLPFPIAPGDSSVIHLKFQSQVPVQIRRSGRHNAEGVDYTMTQWYPKLAAYDENGWHPNPYVGREFYGNFGSYDVLINIRQDYKVGGTGLLQNAEGKWQPAKKTDIRQYYELLPHKSAMRPWHFKAENVHDFAWAADPDFIHYSTPGPDDLTLNFYYLPGEWTQKWDSLAPYTRDFFREMNNRFGKYPYAQFSVIQGGDGGMEYPMCTMLKGTGKLKGLVGVMAHEAAHNWYYGVLASNEFQYPWMDEGFTSYAESVVLNEIWGEKQDNPHQNALAAHNFLVSKAPEGEFEPLSTPADYFSRNRTYGISAYSRGESFLVQLKYIIGEAAFDATMLDYFDQWKFKHPDPWDFLRIAERNSGMQLDWYLNFWLNTTKSVDYAISEVQAVDKGRMKITLERKGEMPLPVEIRVNLRRGSHLTVYIPLVSMFGHKPGVDLHYRDPWPWTHRTYEFEIPLTREEVKSIVIDPELMTSDTDRENNFYDLDE